VVTELSASGRRANGALDSKTGLQIMEMFEGLTPKDSRRAGHHDQTGHAVSRQIHIKDGRGRGSNVV
jgi:ABC-type lipoprotein export system ATPase subunit